MNARPLLSTLVLNPYFIVVSPSRFVFWFWVRVFLLGGRLLDQAFHLVEVPKMNPGEQPENLNVEKQGDPYEEDEETE